MNQRHLYGNILNLSLLAHQLATFKGNKQVLVHVCYFDFQEFIIYFSRLFAL